MVCVLGLGVDVYKHHRMARMAANDLQNIQNIRVYSRSFDDIQNKVI